MEAKQVYSTLLPGDPSEDTDIRVRDVGAGLGSKSGSRVKMGKSVPLKV